MPPVTFVNESTQSVEMSRCLYLHRSWVAVWSINIQPRGIKTIGSSNFASCSVSTPKLPMIRFFVKGVLMDSVVPAKMVQCVQVIIRIEKDEMMTVWGLDQRLSDLFCGGFFWWPKRFLRRGNDGRQPILIGLNEPSSVENAQARSPSLSPLSALSTSCRYSALYFGKLNKSAASSSSSLSSLLTLSSNSATTSDELIGSGHTG